MIDRKSTRLNSSHRTTSYAVFCWNKKLLSPSTEAAAAWLCLHAERGHRHAPPFPTRRSSDLVLQLEPKRFHRRLHQRDGLFVVAVDEDISRRRRDQIGAQRHRADVVEIADDRSEEHTSELQSPYDIVCRLLLE